MNKTFQWLLRSELHFDTLLMNFQFRQKYLFELFVRESWSPQDWKNAKLSSNFRIGERLPRVRCSFLPNTCLELGIVHLSLQLKRTNSLVNKWKFNHKRNCSARLNSDSIVQSLWIHNWLSLWNKSFIYQIRPCKIIS